MQFEQVIQTASFGLTEGSVYERLRRHHAVEFDPLLSHATLIYGASSAKILAQLHREYLDVGQRYQLPMLALTDTWRANAERIRQSGFRGRSVNQDNARFLADIRASYGPAAYPIFIGGQVGPKGDAYAPEQALPAEEAERFHGPQIEALAEARVDLLFASTLPAISEARGIARAMAGLGLPYLLSFVIRRDGALLDGTPLTEAIESIDAAMPAPPTGYAVNCVHPAVLLAALAALARRRTAPVKRILVFQANTSARDPEELDGSRDVETEDPHTLAASMLDVHRQFRIRFLGGCCGTDARHIESMAVACRAASRQQAGEGVMT